MNHPVSKRERGAFFYFDLLRWVAASLVVVNHWRDLSMLTAPEVGHMTSAWKLAYFATGFGKEAVAVFFVLSGYWITSAVERRIERRDFWPIYLIDRLSRLLIVLVPALLIGGLLDYIGRFEVQSAIHRGISGAVSMPVDVAEHLGLVTLLGNLAFLQTILVPTFGSNGPLWSLANEFWYYMWFPALLLLFGNGKARFALVSLLIAGIAPHLLPGFLVWLAGSALFYLDRRAEDLGSTLKPWLMFPAALVAIAAMSVSRLGIAPKDAGLVMTGLGFALFAWVLLRSDPRPLRGGLPLARYGANASFSLYVTHYPLLALVAAVFLEGRRQAPTAEASAILFVGYALAFSYAWLFSRATEKQTPRLRQALRNSFFRPSSSPAKAFPDKG